MHNAYLPVHFIQEFWLVLSEMAPYLLFGFLIAGILYVFIPSALIYKHLGKKGMLSSIKAALIGVPLPLCSCGVIPVAAALRRNGASREATTAFLISTPQTGVDSILVTLSLLGPIYAVFRPFTAFISGVFGGWLVGLFSGKEIPHNHLNNIIDHNCSDSCCSSDEHETKKSTSKINRVFNYGFVMLPRDIGKALIIGLLIAAGISTFISDEFFLNLPVRGIAMMFVMMLVGIPVYVCATASVPIAAMLIAKGISPGAALVFLMTGPATNAATISVIWNTMGRRTAVLYLLAVALTALASGLLLDYIFVIQGANAKPFMPWMFPAWFNTICSILLLAVLGYSMSNLSREKEKKDEYHHQKSVRLKVNDMDCAHCAETIKQTLVKMPGVELVDINISNKTIEVSGDDFDTQNLQYELGKSGYKSELM